MSDRISYYLRIPRAYCQWLGGLRWSYTQEALEYEDVGTFAFSAEVAQFLEGFASGRPLIHFGFVLHLLHLLGYGKIAPPMEAVALRKAYKEAGKPARNAGVLCAVLCQDTPSVAEPPNAAEVCRRLSCTAAMPMLYLSWLVGPYADSTEEPHQGPLAFERAVLARLEKLRPNDLRHWLRHGCGFVPEDGTRIARELMAVKPRTLTGVLAALARNARLAGALPYVGQLVSALALPSRRLVDQELPTGGYADVATRGQPERILPSQFALDELEFIRRFAANELLYYRREEPHVRTREELVILLDQGVRTWGPVRLLLAAAALAFGKLADRRGLPLLLAGTSAPGRLLDPLGAEDREVGELVEASDLSANPGLALERVLEEPSMGERDVVLLTHPRNLAEPDVAAAARRACGGTRLFGVTVDPHGRVQFSEVRHGTPVKLSQFHIDLSAGTSPAKAPPPTPNQAGGALAPWQGDVEPIPFPFRFGVTGRLDERHFDFDHAGEWLLALGQNGMLHACKLDGSYEELLPRPMVEGALMTRIEALLGVAGGFVVVGQIGSRLRAAHYDFGTRTCKAHWLAPVMPDSTWRCFYFRDYHTVVARDKLAWAVDLTTGERCVSPFKRGATDRAVRAYSEALDYAVPPPLVQLVQPNSTLPRNGPALHLSEELGRVRLLGVSPTWPPFIPLADGQPVLQGCELARGLHRGNTLALAAFRHGQPKQVILRVFRGPEGVPLCEFQGFAAPEGFTLSSDGRLLAKLSANRRQIEVHDLTKGGTLTFVSPQGKYHSRFDVELGVDWIVVLIGNWKHLLDWGQPGPLVLHHRGHGRAGSTAAMGETTNASLNLRHDTQSLIGGPAGPSGRPARQGDAAHLTRYDPQRFVAGVVGVAGVVTVVVDMFGQLAVFDEDDKLVCMFYVYQHQVAAWLPDGTRYGPPARSGGPETPGALEKIGNALRAACSRGKDKRI